MFIKQTIGNEILIHPVIDKTDYNNILYLLQHKTKDEKEADEGTEREGHAGGLGTELLPLCRGAAVMWASFSIGLSS